MNDGLTSDHYPRVIHWTIDDSHYVVAESYDEITADGSPLSGMTRVVGYHDFQAMSEIIARTAYAFGNDDGQFIGRVSNTVLPLVDADFWWEASEGHQTWNHRENGGFVLRPLTLADLRTVIRCGDINVTIGARSEIEISSWRTRRGMTIRGATADMKRFIRDLVIGEFHIPFVEFPRMVEEISPDGYLLL